MIKYLVTWKPPLTLLPVFLIWGCKIIGPSTPTIPIDELLSAPEQMEIEGREYVLETFLWRDFQPISPPDGRPLIALIRVTAIDSLKFPSSIQANRLWVIKGEDVWETEFSEETLPPNPNRKHQLQKIARGGPKWGPNIYVDVVVRLVNRGTEEYFLKAPNQLIHRTD